MPIILDSNAGDNGLYPASGVKFADQVKKRAGEAFDYTASGPVASVEGVCLKLPCQYHLGYLVSEKLVIDCLPFGSEVYPVAVKHGESLVHKAARRAAVVVCLLRVRHTGVHELIDTACHCREIADDIGKRS